MLQWLTPIRFHLCKSVPSADKRPLPGLHPPSLSQCLCASVANPAVRRVYFEASQWLNPSSSGLRVRFGPRSLDIASIMRALLEVEKLLPQLSAAEKAQVIQWAARELGDAFPGIESLPGICGGEPCIVRTRIPVWLLEQARRTGITEAELLRCYPTLRAEDIANAWAYVRSHRCPMNAPVSPTTVA